MQRKDDISKRPSMQFIQLVDEFIASAKDLLKVHDKNPIKDLKLMKGLKPVLAALTSLERTMQDPSGKLGIKVSLRNYEIKRTASLGTPESLDTEYDEAVKEKEAADDVKNKLPAQHDLDLARQKELRRQDIDDVFKEELEAIQKTGEDIEENINQDDDLAAQLQTKRDELRKLERKIQSHCCGGAACNKDDIAASNTLEKEIDSLVERQSKIKDRPIKPTGKEAKIKALEDKLKKMKKKIDDSIDGYPAALKAAQKRVDEATRNLSIIERKITDDLLTQCKSVSRDTMFDLVHLRARVSSFFRTVSAVYKKDESTKALLGALLGSRDDWRKRFNEALGCIYYPDTQGRTGLELYSAYTEWAKTHDKEQQKIEAAEYSPNEFIDSVVPNAEAKEVQITRKTSFGIHNFFPAETKRPREKPSEDSASVTPGAKISSSSTTS